MSCCNDDIHEDLLTIGTNRCPFCDGKIFVNNVRTNCSLDHMTQLQYPILREIPCRISQWNHEILKSELVGNVEHTI